MRYSDEVDLKILIDRIRLLVDGAKQVNKRYAAWTPLETVQYAYPLITYCSELMTLLDAQDQPERPKKDTENV